MSTDMIATVQGAAVAQLLRNMDPVATAQREQGTQLIASVIKQNDEKAKHEQAQASALLTGAADTIAQSYAQAKADGADDIVLEMYRRLMARIS